MKEIMSNKQKILVIVGPTSSGKTSMSIKLAKQFNGEVISADSRQVYKGMDIGSGKVTKTEMAGVKHYLLDVASPKSQFSAAAFVKQADKAIKEINKKGKLPIIAGGTMFWVDALIYGLPESVKPDPKLRQKLEKLSAEQLFNKLKKLDPARAKTIDKNNKRRLIRSVEIVMLTGQPVPKLNKQSRYDVIKIGVKRDKKLLKQRIHIRLLARMRQGMVAEVKRLHEQGVSWKRLDDFGLEYRHVAKFLKEQWSKEEMLERLEYEINHYAKRQMTWFNKDKEIFWSENYNKIKEKVKKWLIDK
jgi:tRNA dimethylallyltransferase